MLSITTGTKPLTASLQAQGVSAQKAQLVERDLTASVVAAGGGASATDSGTKADPAVVRKVLDQRIAADVTSGKLTQADADKINKALDEMAATSSDSPIASEAAATGTTATPPGSTASAGGARGGGGGGTSSKTEVSEIVTVAGGMATTTIAYSDGSTETTTAIATSAQEAKTGDTNEANATAPYASQIAPGSLVDTTA